MSPNKKRQFGVIDRLAGALLFSLLI